MKSSLKELNKAQDEYYRWNCHNTKSCQERADAFAVDNFDWVLRTAIAYAESEAKQ